MENNLSYKMADFLEENLPGFIKKIARTYRATNYIDNPDFLEDRLKPWHQFGLMTHTKKVRQAFLYELPKILKDWGVYSLVDQELMKKIGSIEKKTLFEASIPLHDLGKIVVLNDKRDNREHERVSSSLLKENVLYSAISSLDISDFQRDYIERCILLHNVLGKELRHILLLEGRLKLDNLASDSVKLRCNNLIEKYKEMKTEIGIFFICDSLGKTDELIFAKTEKDANKQKRKIELELIRRNLPGELINGIMQSPINLKLAETYFKELYR